MSRICQPRCIVCFCLCLRPKVRACEHTEGLYTLNFDSDLALSAKMI